MSAPPFEARSARTSGTSRSAVSFPTPPAPAPRPLRGHKTLAGVLVGLHQRGEVVQSALVLGLDLHPGDYELCAVRVDVVDQRDGGTMPLSSALAEFSNASVGATTSLSKVLS
jgi:hypothetical protein